MVNQTTVSDSEHNGHSKDVGVRRGVSDLVGDATTLAELQWQLFIEDSREALTNCLKPSIAIMLGAVLVFSSIPIALLGAAYFVTWLGLSMAWALVMVAAVAFSVGALAAYLASRKLQHAADVFARSKLELRQNISWLKRALRRKQSPVTTSVDTVK